MGWFTVVRVGLQLLNTIVQWANRKSLIGLGERQQIARQSAAVLRSAGVTKDMIAEIVNLSDEDMYARFDDSDYVD